MALNSAFTDARSTDNTLQLGTCVFASLGLGQVKSCDIEKKIDVKKLGNCEGGLRTALLQMSECSLTLEVILEQDQVVPGPGEIIAFPEVNLYGILTSIKLSSKEGEARTYTLTASAWDDIGSKMIELEALNGLYSLMADGSGWETPL